MSSALPPDSSATFDDLNLFEEEVEAEGSKGVRGPALGDTAADQRETMAPPMPAPEYVQAMMERGAIDDPPIPPPPRGLTLPRSGRAPLVAPTAPVTAPRPWQTSPRLPPAAPSEDEAPSRAQRPAGSGQAPARRGPGTAPRQATPIRRDTIPQKARPVPPPGSTPSAPTEPPPLMAEVNDPFDELDAGFAVSAAPPPMSPVLTGLRLGRPSGAEEDPSKGDRVTPLVPEPAPSSTVDHLREMSFRFEAQDYSGALVLAESVLAADPQQPDARRCSADCREMLVQRYLRRLGGSSHVPRLVLSSEEIQVLSLDHRTGFLLSSIDGILSIEEVLDVSSMRELEALRLMFDLNEQGVIAIDPPRGRRGKR